MIKIFQYGQVPNSEIFSRVEPKVNVEAVVSEIIANVRRDGDKALLAYCEKFDKCRLTALQVSPEEIDDLERWGIAVIGDGLTVGENSVVSAKAMITEDVKEGERV